MLDFAEAINDSQLVDIGNDGATFSWARGTLFQKLDRILVGEGWATKFPISRITILPRIASDHGPLLIRCKLDVNQPHPSFRFQNMWVRHRSFLPEVAKLWEVETGAYGLRNLQLKLKNVRTGLTAWNKEVFGDIHSRIAEADSAMAQIQAEYEHDPSPANRCAANKAMAELLLKLKMEETTIRWVVEGEEKY